MYIQKEEIFTDPEYNQSSTSEISQATDKYTEFIFTRHKKFFHFIISMYTFYLILRGQHSSNV